MWANTSKQDKGLLISKIVYIYFCFFAMLVAEQFSMNLIYGAALFFVFAALFRMFEFTLNRPIRTIWQKVSAVILGMFLVAAPIYMMILTLLLYPDNNTLFAGIVILMPFVVNAIDRATLRRLARAGSLSLKRIVQAVLPVQAMALLIVTQLLLPTGITGVLIGSASMAVGQAIMLLSLLIFRTYEIEYQDDQEALDIHHIHSVRLYDGMAITSEAALNIFAFTYILFISLSGSLNFFVDFFVTFNVLMLIISAVYISTRQVVRVGWVHSVGRNAAYLIGTACAIFSVFIFSDSWYSGGLAISIQTLLLLAGLTLQMTATQGLREDVMLVIRLYDKDISEDTLHRRTLRLSMWASAITEIVILVVLLLIISNPVFHSANIAEFVQYAPYIGSKVVAVPTVFLLISMVYSIKQPLTKKIDERLKRYYDLRDSGKDNPQMKKRLTHVLIENTRKAIGVQIIRAFLKPIMYHSVEGKKNVKKLPGVFVFNHREIYGPIAAIVFLPYDIRPWIINKMIDKEKICNHMYEGMFSKMKWLPPFIRKGVPKMLSPLVLWALNSFDPIPVYRGSTHDVIKTFTLSVECLCAGDSILLFPENPEDGYKVEVSNFYKGFANIGKMYHRKTGERVMFYPVYASSKRRQLNIGEGVQYNPDSGRRERDRIVETLEQRMQSLQQMDN